MWTYTNGPLARRRRSILFRIRRRLEPSRDRVHFDACLLRRLSKAGDENGSTRLPSAATAPHLASRRQWRTWRCPLLLNRKDLPTEASAARARRKARPQCRRRSRNGRRLASRPRRHRSRRGGLLRRLWSTAVTTLRRENGYEAVLTYPLEHEHVARYKYGHNEFRLANRIRITTISGRPRFHSRIRVQQQHGCARAHGPRPGEPTEGRSEGARCTRQVHIKCIQ